MGSSSRGRSVTRSAPPRRADGPVTEGQATDTRLISARSYPSCVWRSGVRAFCGSVAALVMLAVALDLADEPADPGQPPSFEPYPAPQRGVIRETGAAGWPGAARC